MSAAIITMVRKPQLGKVKTRLAKDVGDQAALDIYTKLLEYTSQQATAVEADRYVFYQGEIVVSDMWDKDLWSKHLQPDGDLGAKLEHAFDQILALHDRVVVIGSDSPQISTAIITSALQQLKRYEVVIGPTYDGGYYLLGMRSLQTSLLRRIPWSSGEEYETTLRRALAGDLSISILPVLADVDYKEDWDKYGQHLI